MLEKVFLHLHTPRTGSTIILHGYTTCPLITKNSQFGTSFFEIGCEQSISVPQNQLRKHKNRTVKQRASRQEAVSGVIIGYKAWCYGIKKLHEFRSFQVLEIQSQLLKDFQVFSRSALVQLVPPPRQGAHESNPYPLLAKERMSPTRTLSPPRSAKVQSLPSLRQGTHESNPYSLPAKELMNPTPTLSPPRSA